MTTTPPRSTRRREEIIPVKRPAFVGVSVTWDFAENDNEEEFAYLLCIGEFWKWFMQTGKGESSKTHLLTSDLFFSAANVKHLIQLCQTTLILYDDAFYKFQLEHDNFHGQWRIVKDAVISCSTQDSGLNGTNPTLIGVSRCDDTDKYTFILKQSMNTFASQGFDLYKKEKRPNDHMFDEWIFKRCQKIFKDIKT